MFTNPDDAEIREILKKSKTLAMVGLSNNRERDSYHVAVYLKKNGYRIIPVNPTVIDVMGMKSFPELSLLPERIDIVNVFRSSEYLHAVVEEALRIKPGCIWTQLGVIDDNSANEAVSRGIPVIMDRCIKIEHRRLLGSNQGPKEILGRLACLYPDASTGLQYGSIFQLLVAVMLSAQCTDKQVNRITALLFKKYSKPEDFAVLNGEELADQIRGCGLFRNKSRNIINTSRILVEKYASRVPDNREDLEALPGVGRKTANVVLNIAFNKPVMPVDTHVYRVSRRLGLSAGKSTTKVERDLQEIIPPGQIGMLHHCLIFHGRSVCRARNPRCGDCSLADICPGVSTRPNSGSQEGKQQLCT